MLLFCFAFNESLLDSGCESATSGLWVVPMSLNNSCGDNSKLSIVPYLGSGGIRPSPRRAGFVSKPQAEPSVAAGRWGEVGRLLPLFAWMPGAL